MSAFAPDLTVFEHVSGGICYTKSEELACICDLFAYALGARDAAYWTKIVLGVRGITKLVFLHRE